MGPVTRCIGDMTPPAQPYVYAAAHPITFVLTIYVLGSDLHE